MPNTLTISFTPASPAPANGYRVKYWSVNSPATINTVSPNPTTSPVLITGLASGCYAGTVEAACGGSQFSSAMQFNACSSETCLTGTTSASSNCSGGQTSTFALTTGQQASVSMSGYFYSGSGTRTITGSLLDNSNTVIQNFTYTQIGSTPGTTSPSSYQITNSSGSSVTYKLQVNQVNCSGSNGSGTATMSVGNCQPYSAPGGGGGSGTSYCVAVTSESFTESSNECPGVNDTYTVYTFTLKNSAGTSTVNAPTNVDITFTGWSTYPGGASAYNGSATINAGSSSTTATVYTSQALNGAPGCPCPCGSTISVDTNSFAASISSPNTVSICAGSGSGGSGGGSGSGGSGGGPGGSGGGSGGGGGVNNYDCVNGNCVATVGGAFNSLVECQQFGCSGGGGLPQE